MVIRAYTPVTADDERGYFNLLIKVYFANVHLKYPEGGKMSQYLNNLAIGGFVKIQGSFGHFEYKGNFEFQLHGEMRSAKKIGLICGGTGITPTYQLMQAVAKDAADDTEVFLIYGNRRETDILLREEIGKLGQQKNYHVWYTLDTAPKEGWAYSIGFVTEEMIKQHMPSAGADTIIGMCGPQPMVDTSCVPNLENLGFGESSFFPF